MMANENSRIALSNDPVFNNIYYGSMDGAAVRAPASHQCGSGSIPALFVILALLRGFSAGTPVFLLPEKPTFINSNWT